MLEEYQRKRDFEKSPEPIAGSREEVRDSRRNIFVIQEHNSRRLHWDLRLEIGGVLRSWAVPKSPIDVNYGTRRLAIQVEDHPIEYSDFEGEIPAGMYGAGTVKIWDNGEFILEENKIDKMVFELKGKKMNGIYTLVYVPKMGENSWLFIKNR